MEERRSSDMHERHAQHEGISKATLGGRKEEAKEIRAGRSLVARLLSTCFQEILSDWDYHGV